MGVKNLFLSTLIGVLLSGCTVYKSEGRKKFESEGPSKIQTSAFELISCKNETKLETWLNDEFPASNYELVVADTDLEIWRSFKGDYVEVKALQRTPRATHSCLYQFANDLTWTLYKDQFIKELENNMMMAE